MRLCNHTVLREIEDGKVLRACHLSQFLQFDSSQFSTRKTKSSAIILHELKGEIQEIIAKPVLRQSLAYDNAPYRKVS